jgi:nucleotide-binding universal stress UspA family protein
LLKKILVPVDGSEPSDKALKQACNLAEKYDAEVKILNVAGKPAVYAGTYPGMIYPRPYMMGMKGYAFIIPTWVEDYSAKLVDTNKVMLEEARKKAEKDHPSLEISTELVTGKPADKIVEVSKEGNFDLIVMGSHGFGGFDKLLLGSVSHGVVNKSECPVFLIK